MRFVPMTVLVLALALIAATLPALVWGLHPPLPAVTAGPAGAVVVLGAGRRPAGDGYALNTDSLTRLQKGLSEARQRHLPLLLSGGAHRRPKVRPARSEAALMAAEVQRLWPDADPILEPDSGNTWENARNSARLLADHGIDSVVLVTHRAHLPRAMLCFQAQGIQVIPVPAESMPTPAWLPSAGVLAQVPMIWREWLALLWYHVKYRV